MRESPIAGKGDVALKEAHLRRLVGEYVTYFHHPRPHDSLGKDAPEYRRVEHKLGLRSLLTAHPRLGGLHHRYTWREAAPRRHALLLPGGRSDYSFDQFISRQCARGPLNPVSTTPIGQVRAMTCTGVRQLAQRLALFGAPPQHR